MSWDSYRHILAIARAGSLSGAARRLGKDQTTVSRRLAAAEETLGARLFDRIDGRMVPTEAGEAAIARIARMEAAAEGLAQAVTARRDQPVGRIRLTAVPFLINHVIVPELPTFSTAYPEIVLDLIPDARNLSLTRRQADIALRLSRPKQDPGALTRRIGVLKFAAYHAVDNGSDAWIGYGEDRRHLPQAEWIAEAVAAGQPSAPLSVADIETAHAAVAAGLGRSLLPCRIADADPRLRRIGRDTALTREVWMLIQGDTRHSGRMTVLAEWLPALFTDPD